MADREATLRYYRERNRIRRQDLVTNRKKNEEQRAKKRGAFRAQKAVEHALERGGLVKEPCSVCGAKRLVHAHHEDYRRPLDVVWLCPIHHAERHAELRAAGVREIPGAVIKHVPRSGATPISAGSLDTPGGAIASLRLSARMSRAQLAAFVGVTQMAVTKWEAGMTKKIKANHLVLLESIFEP